MPTLLATKINKITNICIYFMFFFQRNKIRAFFLKKKGMMNLELKKDLLNLLITIKTQRMHIKKGVEKG